MSTLVHNSEISAPYEQCQEWVEDNSDQDLAHATRRRCGEHRNAHDNGALGHDFLSAAEADAQGAQGYGQTRHDAQAPKRHRDFTPRDMLVRVDDDAIVNPSFVAAMIEDTYTHRDGQQSKTTTRVSVYLHNRQHPIVVENATLDDVLARLDVGDWKPQDFALSEQDRAIADSLIGDKP